MLSITQGIDADFYSLQTPISAADKALLKQAEVNDLESELISYAHTAALIEQLDLVVSVCTSVVHVAGALGKKAFVLLSPHADWRWLEDEQSQWYPQTTVYRQAATGDWGELTQRVGRDIRNLTQ